MFENLSRNQRKDLHEALQMAQRRAQAPWSPSGWTNPLSNVVNRRAFLRGGAALVGGITLAEDPWRAIGCSPGGGTVFGGRLEPLALGRHRPEAGS